jgi:rhodanese-related sulfurtransferase
MSINFLQAIEFMNNRLSNIENGIARIEDKLDFSIQLQRNHLIRIKNGEDVDDSMILMGRPYNDLSPEQAYKIYSDQDGDFIMIDVSSHKYKGKRIKGAIHIPLEELNRRYAEVQSRTLPVLIVSEQGLRSIQAAELLVKKGFFNINNVSGGLKFWPAFEFKQAEVG